MEFCYKSATIWQIIGNILLILKIIIPLVIIILGMVEFGKCVIRGDEKAIKETTMKLIKKIIAGIVIFFIPVIIRLLFLMVSQFSADLRNDFDNCIDCLTRPNSTECDTSRKNEVFK